MSGVVEELPKDPEKVRTSQSEVDPRAEEDEKASVKAESESEGTTPVQGTPKTQAAAVRANQEGGKDLADFGDVYEEVRAIDLGADGKEKPIETDFDWGVRLVSLEDDPEAPVWTFRLMFSALGWGCFGAALSQIFQFRPQVVFVSLLFLEVFSYILGRLMDYAIPGPGSKLFPTKDTPFWRFMNPGTFNIKEHTGILIASTAATHSAIAINIFAANDLFYNFKVDHATAIFTLFGSQLIGYGLAGMMRSFLVWPTHQVFPNLMPVIQMLDMLHRGKDSFLQKKRQKFFWFVFIGIFVWEWFPEYIAPTLTGVSIFCLARQHSATVSQIFGGAAGNEGLGLFSLCFDWQYVGSGGGAYGALFQPLASQMGLYAAAGLCIIITTAAYHANLYKAKNFPFLSQLLFNEDGSPYDQLAILNDDFTLNTTKLEEVGLPWYSTSNLIYMIGQSLGFGATITHLLLWHGGQIVGAWREARHGEIEDPHWKKMQVYKEVPWLVWAGVFVGCIAIALATIYTADSGLPWWGFLIALGFSVIMLPVISTFYGTVLFVVPTETVARMLGAAIFPGKPIANMWFTLYAYNSTEQGRSMTRDLKLAQYVKLKPWATFSMQITGAVIGALLNYVLMLTIIDAHRDILLDVQGTNIWSGATVQAFNSDAITWGALSKHLYAPNARYGIVPMCIFIGLAIPIPFWLVHKKWPNLGAKHVITPMIVANIGYLSTGINSSIFGKVLMGIFSQYYLRKYRPTWFRKYNFLLSAALDGGTEVMIFIFSFALAGAGGTSTPFPTWALNPDYSKTNPDYCKKLN